ncbi:MAG: phosphoenolpyruvate synthase/pyruvate phosphate dikinase [Desulfobacterales bacterium]|nr:phosphoenolpyruvate synthase/pyruvate phosphate dikinase [Desulfobacterales bacterium]
MTHPLPQPITYDAKFKVYHELMAKRILEILLVLSPFDAFIMEEDDSLASRIVNEYQGLNLTRPPRTTRVASAGEALAAVRNRHFDMVITMPQVGEMDCFALGLEIKKIHPRLPVILLAHRLSGLVRDPEQTTLPGIDYFYIWSPNPALLLALIKSLEDRLNVNTDTRLAMVRVLLLVEDSPHYRSFFLPLIYREVVQQTQAVLGETLNEEHRILKMRARPKILVAESYEQALALFRRFRPYLFGIISDTRFRKSGKPDDRAGLKLLAHVRKKVADMPLLLLSSDPGNREPALEIPAVFMDKSAPGLQEGLHDFFLNHLGFGDFVFRLPDGTEIDRAENLAALEAKLAAIPAESLLYHAGRNHFSNWVMARSEIDLAANLHRDRLNRLTDPGEMRREIIDQVHTLRRLRQQGVVAQYNPRSYDPEIMDFVKIGTGSMGGKALGLAFMAMVLARQQELGEQFPDLPIRIPKTLVITTNGFDAFMEHNQLTAPFPATPDEEIAARFLAAEMPGWLTELLASFLAQVRAPLTVRSSSILEDAHFRPFAGLYSTYMLANNQPGFARRLAQLLDAVKLVFASTYFAGPRAFARTIHPSGRREGMAVIVQVLAGRDHGEFFYPAISGTAQSYNYYPVGPMRPEDGIVNLALGFGKTVVEGEQSLRFSPAYPEHLPQFSTVDDMLANSQRYFYALRLQDPLPELRFSANANLERRLLSRAATEAPVAALTSAYLPDEHRIRDSGTGGIRVLTYARILKHKLLPLPELLTEVLGLARTGMGCAVEIEFVVELPDAGNTGAFYLLQTRPIAAGGKTAPVRIGEQEKKQAFCVSSQALGNGELEDIADIVQVRLDSPEAGANKQAAREIAKFNSRLLKEERPYLLIGPGRWGSADPWLGIPVQWQDISGVGVMLEHRSRHFSADPSQGTHFFQNITAMGIPYFTINEKKPKKGDFFDWQWLARQPAHVETGLIRHIRFKTPFTIKIDGSTSHGIMYMKRRKS